MLLLALRTIRALHPKMTRSQCLKMINKFVDIISRKYPDGFEDIKDSRERLLKERTTYFVLPKFTHVTKNQPIIKWNFIEKIWEIDVTTNHYL